MNKPKVYIDKTGPDAEGDKVNVTPSSWRDEASEIVIGLLLLPLKIAGYIAGFLLISAIVVALIDYFLY